MMKFIEKTISAVGRSPFFVTSGRNTGIEVYLMSTALKHKGQPFLVAISSGEKLFCYSTRVTRTRKIRTARESSPEIVKLG